MASLPRIHLVLAIGVLLGIASSIGHEGFGIITCGATKGVHHVVGGDPGWGAATNIASWSVDKVYKVGDSLWFTYSATGEYIAEVESREEFESCELHNPIRMYTEELNEVSLVDEGSRYFVSSKPELCEKGVKLHVEVLPETQAYENEAVVEIERKEDDDIRALAEGPKTSGANCNRESFVKWSALALIYFICLQKL
ncbi:cucumber peeling cupredoxin-like [Typha latifolia]|uniref:cucumber peeling cupredoxin-like n=1 Tax=Typha latifolia TaxID=4733 RepID=UPI003C2CE76E